MGKTVWRGSLQVLSDAYYFDIMVSLKDRDKNGFWRNFLVLSGFIMYVKDMKIYCKKTTCIKIFAIFTFLKETLHSPLGWEFDIIQNVLLLDSSLK